MGSLKDRKITLPSGNSMPLIGIGTLQIRGDQILEMLDSAFASGYRLIDAATLYANEQEIGAALKELLPKHGLKREDIFITSKLSPSDQGQKAADGLKATLQNLDCGYLDLYLINWPGVAGIPLNSPENPKLRSASWAALIKAQQQGLVKDIGVANYTITHLTELLNNSHGVKPAVNQIEWHPHNCDSEIKDLCDEEGIILQAYSSLGGTGNKSLLSDRTVAEIASRLQKSPAQVLLRWAIQQNIPVIPKARSKEHMEENMDLDFELDDNDMFALNNSDRMEKYAWNPNCVK